VVSGDKMYACWNPTLNGAEKVSLVSLNKRLSGVPRQSGSFREEIFLCFWLRTKEVFLYPTARSLDAVTYRLICLEHKRNNVKESCSFCWLGTNVRSLYIMILCTGNKGLYITWCNTTLLITAQMALTKAVGEAINNIYSFHGRKYTYKCNIVVSSRNHFCRGKAITITYCECVCSLSYPACKVHGPHCIISCGLSDCTILYTISRKRHNFRENIRI
jgi:hypothetical protein